MKILKIVSSETKRYKTVFFYFSENFSELCIELSVFSWYNSQNSENIWLADD